MPRFSSAFRNFPALIGVAAWGFIATAELRGQDDSEPLEPKPFDAIEGRFFQVQDASGYFWQAAENGALTSGETQYLQSGLNLLVEGAVFAPEKGTQIVPTEASREAGAISLSLEENRESLRIERSLAYDLDRGGVRVFDSFTNLGKEAVVIDIDLRTTYPFAWQSLHNQSGGVLSKDPALMMKEGDTGILVHFSPAEGRHDTFLLANSGDGAPGPKLNASSNRRELTLGYSLSLVPGETISLLHWVLQVGLQGVEDIEKTGKTLFQNGELVEPRISREQVPSVVNFSTDSFPQPRASAGELRQLISLNSALERIGAQRRSSAILWLDSSNQLTGKITGTEVIEIDDTYRGPQSVARSEVAAILDPGVGGQVCQVFLRDGRVLVGKVETLDLSFLPEGSETSQTLAPGGFSALLFPVEEQDGNASDEVVGFLELIDGAVLQVNAKDGLEFLAVTLLGQEAWSAEQVAEMQYLAEPIPHFRWVGRSGDRFSGFLAVGALKVMRAEEAPVEIPTAFVSRFGRNGLKELTVDGSGDSWIDFEEVPDDWVPEQGFLLESGGIRAGTFAEETLLWKKGAQTVKIETEAITRMRRVTSKESGVFELTLKSGEVLGGRPVHRVLNILLGEIPRLLPVEKIYAYRSSSS